LAREQREPYSDRDQLAKDNKINDKIIMASLNLKSTDIEDEGTLLSWNDVESAGAFPMIGMCLGIVLTGVGVFFIDPSVPSAAFLGSVLAALFLGWIPGLILSLMFKGHAEREQPRSLAVFPKSIEHSGRAYHLDEVSRVEYGRKGDWNNSDPQTADHRQIRIWFEDADFIVVSENNWTAQVNHQLHRAIQDTIGGYQRRLKDVIYAEQETEQSLNPKGGKDGFGIPDY